MLLCNVIVFNGIELTQVMDSVNFVVSTEWNYHSFSETEIIKYSITKVAE